MRYLPIVSHLRLIANSLSEDLHGEMQTAVAGMDEKARHAWYVDQIRKNTQFGALAWEALSDETKGTRLRALRSFASAYGMKGIPQEMDDYANDMFEYTITHYDSEHPSSAAFKTVFTSQLRGLNRVAKNLANRYSQEMPLPLDATVVGKGGEEMTYADTIAGLSHDPSQTAELSAALAKLPDLLRQVMTMYAGGETFDEIGQALGGKSRQYAKQLYDKARAFLKDQLSFAPESLLVRSHYVSIAEEARRLWRLVCV